MSEKKADTSVPNLDQLDSGWDEGEEEGEEDDLDAGWGDVGEDEPEEARASEPPGLSREEREARAVARKERARAKAAAKKERRRARAVAAASGQKTKQKRGSSPTHRDAAKSAPVTDAEDEAPGEEPSRAPLRRTSQRKQPRSGIAKVRRDWQRMGILVGLVVLAGTVVVFLVRR